MDYESIAYEAEGRMGYWLIVYEGERNNCFSKIQLVGQKNIDFVSGNIHQYSLRLRRIILNCFRRGCRKAYALIALGILGAYARVTTFSELAAHSHFI